MNLWQPSQSSASTSTPVSDQAKALQQSQPPQVSLFNQETLQQSLQALIEGARESWTYVIFWQSSYDYSGAAVLGWGDGYYKGEEDKGKAKLKTLSSAAEQAHRKKVLRELNSLISGSSPTTDDAVDEEITDTEWFFLVSMTHSFVNGNGLPGQAFLDSRPVWVAGKDQLANSPCERARQGQQFGLQTMACIPSANGVVELGSTELILQNSDLMNKIMPRVKIKRAKSNAAGPIGPKQFATYGTSKYPLDLLVFTFLLTRISMNNNLKLGVDVVSGHNLLPEDGLGSSSAFVELYFDRQKFQITIKEKDLNPVWNESF